MPRTTVTPQNMARPTGTPKPIDEVHKSRDTPEGAQISHTASDPGSPLALANHMQNSAARRRMIVASVGSLHPPALLAPLPLRAPASSTWRAPPPSPSLLPIRDAALSALLLPLPTARATSPLEKDAAEPCLSLRSPRRFPWTWKDDRAEEVSLERERPPPSLVVEAPPTAARDNSDAVTTAGSPLSSSVLDFVRLCATGRALPLSRVLLESRLRCRVLLRRVYTAFTSSPPPTLPRPLPASEAASPIPARAFIARANAARKEAPRFCRSIVYIVRGSCVCVCGVWSVTTQRGPLLDNATRTA